MCFGRSQEHTYDFTLEFKKMPDEDFYKKLDEHFDCFKPGKYSYSVIWGNGLEAQRMSILNSIIHMFGNIIMVQAINNLKLQNQRVGVSQGHHPQ